MTFLSNSPHTCHSRLELQVYWTQSRTVPTTELCFNTIYATVLKERCVQKSHCHRIQHKLSLNLIIFVLVVALALLQAVQNSTFNLVSTSFCLLLGVTGSSEGTERGKKEWIKGCIELWLHENLYYHSTQSSGLPPLRLESRVVRKWESDLQAPGLVFFTSLSVIERPKCKTALEV
jgi:hypothetical protein